MPNPTLAFSKARLRETETDLEATTLRLRLDRLIQKILILDDHRPASAFERRLRLLYADGRLDLDTLKTLLVAHEEALGERA